MSGGRAGEGAESWRYSLEVPAALVAPFMDLLEGAGPVAAVPLTSDAGSVLPSIGPWRLDIYGGKEAEADLAARVALAAAVLGLERPPLARHPVAAEGWIAGGGTPPPFPLAGFVLGGAETVATGHHHRRRPWRLGIESAGAFGTGRHESTAGCLLALWDLAARRRFHAILDLGCGSGVLSLAACRLWPGGRPGGQPVIAADIDPQAVAACDRNRRRNGLTAAIRPLVSDSPRRRRIARWGPYDLIMANILARPLVRLAPAVAAAVAPGGAVVLAGFLGRDSAWVVSAYRRQGLYLAGRRDLGAWTTLMMAAPRGKGAARRLVPARRDAYL